MSISSLKLSLKLVILFLRFLHNFLRWYYLPLKSRDYLDVNRINTVFFRIHRHFLYNDLLQTSNHHHHHMITIVFIIINAQKLQQNNNDTATITTTITTTTTKTSTLSSPPLKWKKYVPRLHTKLTHHLSPLSRVLISLVTITARYSRCSVSLLDQGLEFALPFPVALSCL